MNAPKGGAAALIARLTCPGAPFELTEVMVGGRTMKAYRNAPRTLVEWIDAGRAHGAKEFIAYQGDRWSYDRFFAAADALAGRMQTELGLRPGDRVAIAMRNRPEWAVALVAAVLAGAIPTPLNSFGTGDELRAALGLVDPSLLFVDAERLQRLEPDLAGLRGRTVLADAEHAAGSGVLSFASLAAPGGPTRTPVTPAPEDPALLLFTSGASTRPKAVLSTQRAVAQSLFNIDFIGALSGMSSPKAVATLMARALAPATLTVVPLFHVSGLHAQLLTTLRAGRRLVLMHRWDPVQALRMIVEEKITQFNGAPSMVAQLLATAGFDPAGSARTLGGVGFGGAGLPQGLIERVLGLFPDSMSGIGFGLTETNGAVSAISGALFEAKPHSSGPPSPLAEVRIVGPDGAALTPGQAGEVWVRGVTVMREYWRQPEATAAALNDGWFRTGDIGYLDDDGFLFVVDRIKDVINRAGEKIAAAEVESCLSEHPAVREVAVIAAPDPETGEAMVAVVVPNPGVAVTPQELQSHVAARLAAYKVPSRVILREAPLPRNPAGKLVKPLLKQELGAA
jgi:long-chain acyl-CoA synthetase